MASRAELGIAHPRFFGMSAQDALATKKAEAAELREKKIRGGRAWASTHLESSYLNLSSLDDECCITISEMLSSGRDGLDVVRYVRRCGQLGRQGKPRPVIHFRMKATM
jgi:hypothetical protein